MPYTEFVDKRAANVLGGIASRFRSMRASKRLAAYTDSWMSLAAFGCFAVGAFLIAVPLGFAVTGGVLLLAEWRLDG